MIFGNSWGKKSKLTSDLLKYSILKQDLAEDRATDLSTGLLLKYEAECLSAAC